MFRRLPPAPAGRQLLAFEVRANSVRWSLSGNYFAVHSPGKTKSPARFGHRAFLARPRYPAVPRQVPPVAPREQVGRGSKRCGVRPNERTNVAGEGPHKERRVERMKSAPLRSRWLTQAETYVSLSPIEDVLGLLGLSPCALSKSQPNPRPPRHAYFRHLKQLRMIPQVAIAGPERGLRRFGFCSAPNLATFVQLEGSAPAVSRHPFGLPHRDNARDGVAFEKCPWWVLTPSTKNRSCVRDLTQAPSNAYSAHDTKGPEQ